MGCQTHTKSTQSFHRMKKITIKPEGFFKVLESTPRSQIATMVLTPKSSTGGPSNKHTGSDQWLYVLSGKGKAIVEGKAIPFKSGDILLIEKGETHEIINTGTGSLKTFSIYAPPAY